MDEAERAAFLESINSNREGIESSGRETLFAIAGCGQRGIPIPEWLAIALSQRLGKVLQRKAHTWEEVFGSLWPKGYQVDARRKKFSVLRPRVTVAIRDALVNDPKQAIDKDFWERIGAAAGVSATVAEEIYRDALGGFGRSIQQQRNELALMAVALAMKAADPTRVADGGFFSELGVRAGVPVADAEHWWMEFTSAGFELNPDAVLDLRKYAPAKSAKGAGVRGKH